ncbi:hypothetical protein J4459_03385 [Candidatus Woesearchaeota archaeon]|nr:hypothetical protein [Candidatus Woesearchaeota archaeon]
MAKLFEEAKQRLFGNVYVCKKCKKKTKAQLSKIRLQKIKCKGCQGKSFRPIKSKK